MLIVDTGPLYAAAAKADRNHERCVGLLSEASRPLVVPQLVVTEVAYLLADRLGPKAEAAFADSLSAGELVTQPVLASEWGRIAELVEQYGDLELGIVDASVVALAERLNVSEIASLDHKHLATVRPRHTEALLLLP